MLNENVQFRTIETQSTPSAQVPADVYQVVLESAEVKNGETYNSKQGKTAEKEFEDTLTLKWRIVEDPFKGQVLFSNFIPTFFHISPKTGKNKLFKVVEALTNSILTTKQLEGFTAQSFNDLIGKQCRAMVENTTKNDKTYSNITNWLPSKTEAPQVKSTDDTKAFEAVFG